MLIAMAIRALAFACVELLPGYSLSGAPLVLIGKMLGPISEYAAVKLAEL